MDAATDLAARLLPVMLVVIGLPFAARAWARRSGAAGPAVRITGRTALHRGAVVGVLEVGRRRFLVGATDHGVNLLAELDPDDFPSPPTTPTAPYRGPGTGLLDRLQRMQTSNRRPPRVTIH